MRRSGHRLPLLLAAQLLCAQWAAGDASAPETGSTLLVTCPDLPAPTHGNVLKPRLDYMSVAHYSCDAGYKLTGPQKRQCQADGTWDGDPPSCGGTCETPVQLASGVMYGNNFNTGSQIMFGCNARFRLVGSSSRTCTGVTDPVTGLSDKSEWTGTMPKCTFEGDHLQERDILKHFFNATNGNTWKSRLRRANSINNNDLYSTSKSSTDPTATRLTEDNIDPSFKPRSTVIESRSIGWNSSSVHGCNTITCHCSWQGVTCNNDGFVIKLDLSNNGLSGYLPAELGALPKLEVLILSHNYITGTIPEGWGGPVGDHATRFPALAMHGQRAGFEKLRILHLNANHLSGLLPSTLDKISQLEELHLSDNKLTGLQASWSGFTSLKSLWLHSNQMRGTLPPTMGDMHDLAVFHGMNNHFTGPVPSTLGGLAHLRHLDLSLNELEGPIPTNLATVRYVNLVTRGMSTGDSPCGKHDNRGTTAGCAWMSSVRPSGNLFAVGETPVIYGAGQAVAMSIEPARIIVNVPNHYVLTGGGLRVGDWVALVDKNRACEGVSDKDTLSGRSQVHWAAEDGSHANVTVANFFVRHLKSPCDHGVRVCYLHTEHGFTFVQDILCDTVGTVDAASTTSIIPPHLTPTSEGVPGIPLPEQAARRGD